MNNDPETFATLSSSIPASQSQNELDGDGCDHYSGGSGEVSVGDTAAAESSSADGGQLAPFESTAPTAKVSRKRPFQCIGKNTASVAKMAVHDDKEFEGSTMGVSEMRGMEAMVKRMVSSATRKITADMQSKLNVIEKDHKEENMALEKKCNILTDRCHELENNVKDLTLRRENQEWTYSADDVPMSYWLSNGYGEIYARNMRVFLQSMKKQTHRLRRGNAIECINFVFGTGEVDDFLHHDDVLLPHWEEFVAAFAQYQKFAHHEDHAIEQFIIHKVELGPEVLDILAPVMKSSNVRDFALSDNDLESDVISFVADIVESNPKLQALFLNSNPIENMDDLRYICNSIRSKVGSHFHSLSLEACVDGNEPDILCPILDACNDLECLDLGRNGIGSQGMTLIEDFLASNYTIKQMDLQGNILSDDDAALLANALQYNTNLVELYLEDNNITEIGRNTLLGALFNVSSLNLCAGSNHTCEVKGLDPDISAINKGNSASIRAMKTFTILSATDQGLFNMDCFDGVPVAMMPKMLSLAQQFTEDIPELSEAFLEQTGVTVAPGNTNQNRLIPRKNRAITCVFELLRGWVVPSLFA